MRFVHRKNYEVAEDVFEYGFITAREWREMSSDNILRSLEVAATVLGERDLDAEERRYLVHIVRVLLGVLSKKLK